MTNEEINRRIAEEVMGWKEWHGREWLCLSEDIACNPVSDYTGYSVHTFSPSEKIHHAWLVVEEMKRLGLTIELYLLSNSTWDCWIYSNDGFTAGYIENEKSVEIAICLAALDAVGDKS